MVTCKFLRVKKLWIAVVNRFLGNLKTFVDSFRLSNQRWIVLRIVSKALGRNRHCLLVVEALRFVLMMT